MDARSRSAVLSAKDARTALSVDGLARTSISGRARDVEAAARATSESRDRELAFSGNPGRHAWCGEEGRGFF